MADTENLSEILQVRRDKLKELQDSGRDPFEIVRFDRTAMSEEIRNGFDAFEGKTVAIAGRMMSKRVMGKASFFHIQDGEGTIQCYARRDVMGDEPYAEFKKLDIGDILGVTGEVFRTNAGEISVKCHEVTLLSKSLLPLPEKFHGLRDTDTRYRQRYVDLIVNPEVKRTFVLRSRIIKHVRKYLDDRGYIEVETPVLNTISGGASARPFITHHNTLDLDLYMRIATELPLKRLIIGGMEKVYEIGRIFRNEGMDTKHNPEFTSIELYEAYTDLYGMMEIAEGIFSSCAKEILGSYEAEWMGHKIDLSPGWKRMTMIEAVKEYVGIDFSEISDDAEAVKAAAAAGVELAETAEKTWGNALYACFDQKVEERLIQPCFITMYPVEVSPLTKRSKDDPRLTERFEFFICSSEMGNAYSELNDPIDQRQRFLKQLELRDRGDEEAEMLDEDFLTAMEYGMPPTGGMGIGIDRFVMMMTNSDSIRDVLLFPTMKPLDKNTSEAKNAQVSENDPEAAPSVNVSDPSMPIFDANKPDFASLVIEPLFEDLVDFETFSRSDFRAVKVKDCVAVPKSKKLLQFTLDDGTGTDRIILSGIHAYYEPEQLIGKTCIAITNLPPRKMMGIDSCGMLISAVHKEGEDEKLHLLMVDPGIPAGAKLY